MPLLTREIIEHINAYWEYNDLYNEFEWPIRWHSKAAEYSALREAEGAHFTDAHMVEYWEEAEIRPPHAVGEEAHAEQVDAYFASFIDAVVDQ